MADKKMNEFSVNSEIDYLYTEKGGNQYKATPSKVMEKCGFFNIYKTIGPGEEYVLPYSSGLIVIQNASAEFQKSFAILNSNNMGKVLVQSTGVNFFSEIPNKICVFNKSINTNLIIKNTYNENKTVSITLINAE